MLKQVIEIVNLNYSYPDGTRALSGVSFSVTEGESIGLIGPNGAGKSTILLHLNGIFQTMNAVKICGDAVSEKKVRLIRGKVGLVFQDPDDQLFMPTVFEDVAFGPLNQGKNKSDVEKAVETALSKVDLVAAKGRLAHHMSFGERKRIAIATVLSMNPDIIVLDEPSSNLDPRHRRGLIDLLNDLSQTKIIATHDLDMVVETCNRVILIDKGKVVSDGEVSMILRDKSLLESHGLEVPPMYKYQK